MITKLQIIIRVCIVVIFILGNQYIGKTSISYKHDRIMKVNKLQEIGIDQCKNNDGLYYVRYNTIFHHKIYCNNGTTIKYTGEL